MSTPRPLSTDALLKKGLSLRAGGPDITADLLEDVLTAVGSTTQDRAWSMGFARIGRPSAILAAALLLLAAIVAGVLSAAGQPPRSDGASFIAGYWKLHVGSAFVFADGRVIFHPEGKAFMPIGAIHFALNERRLSPAGLDLVRSGMVPASAFVKGPELPASAWADAEVRPYKPSRYALCFWLGTKGEHGPDGDVDVARVLDRLPVPAQALLRGRERAFLWSSLPVLTGPQATPTSSDCSELTLEQAHTLTGILLDAGWHAVNQADWMQDPNATWSPTGS